LPVDQETEQKLHALVDGAITRRHRVHRHVPARRMHPPAC
jgi:hypothetical protein